MPTEPQTPRPPDRGELIEGELIEASPPVPVAGEAKSNGAGAGAVDAVFDVAERVVAPVARLGWRTASGIGRRLGVNRAVEQAVDRGIDRALESDAAERAADRVLGSDAAQRVWTKVLESDEAQALVERVAEAPEVRSAITSQGVGLLEDVRRSARELARKLDDIADRTARRALRRTQRSGRPAEAGAATRLLAIGLDALILNLILLLISTLVASLLSTIFGLGGESRAVTIAFGAFAWLIASAFYLGLFWTLAERTPGMTFFALRIRDSEGGHVPPRQDLRRLVGFYLAVIPFFLGFKGILFRDDRRGWHDRFAGTIVLYGDPEIDPGVEAEGHIRQVRYRKRVTPRS
jgi:uncharacterized RDD family membrane protein YckC